MQAERRKYRPEAGLGATEESAISPSSSPVVGRRGFLQSVGVVGAGAVIANGGSPVHASPAVAAMTPVDERLHGPRWAARPFALDRVTLGAGSVFAEKRDRILRLLSGYPVDRVLHNFRRTAGLPVPPDSSPPGGWDDEVQLIRGHYSGHLLTAFAQAWASTKDPLYKEKVDEIVRGLGACQDALTDQVGEPAPPPPPVERVAGRVGQAVRLNGESQFVELPAGLVAELNDFTLAAWVRPQERRTWSRIADFGSGDSNYLFLALSAGSAPRFAITTGGAEGEQQLTGDSELPVGEWTHIAVTKSGRTATLYVGGAVVATNNAMTLSPADLGSTDKNWLGKSQYGDPLLAGDLDEVQIHSSALTADQVRSLAGRSDDLLGGDVGWYRFDQENPEKATDSSGSEHHGTVISESTGAPGPEFPGYLSAFPEQQFIDFENGGTFPDVWVPYYSLHKIIKGLLDAHVLVGNAQALDIVDKVGGWVHARLSRLSRDRLNEIWAQPITNGEYGGMNEVLADLYALTGKRRHLRTAQLFDNRQSLFAACVENRDIITRLHANTHVPQFLGYLRMYDVGTDREYFTATRNFWGMVVPHRMYSHGGTGGTWESDPEFKGNTNPELFQPRDNIAHSIAANGGETCTSYNLLKMARFLFFHTTDAAFMDYYERTLLNHILGSKADVDSSESPEVTYFLPLTPGSRRSYGNTGICCGGTGLENHTKYQESIYFRSADNSALYVNLYAASTLNWSERDFTVTQTTDYPREDTVRLDVDGSGWLDLKLRVPFWCDGFEIRVNGRRHDAAIRPGRYLTVRRRWSPGDRVEISLPFTLRIERAIDDHAAQSIFSGPLLLPALSDSQEYRQFTIYPDLKLDGDLGAAITDQGDGTFETNSHTLRPMYIGDEQPHHPYFRRHEPLVMFGSVNSGVPNYEESEGGNTFLDDVWAQAPFPSHARFVATVRRTSAIWRRRGLLTRAERTAVIEAAQSAESAMRPR